MAGVTALVVGGAMVAGGVIKGISGAKTKEQQRKSKQQLKQH